MKAAGVKASHQHSVSIAALELAGAGRSSSPLWKEEDEEIAEEVLLGKVQAAFPESLFLWKEGIHE